MRTVYVALGQLDETRRRRAMRWLVSRFDVEHVASRAAAAVSA
jgi:hypothetical protein